MFTKKFFFSTYSLDIFAKKCYILDIVTSYDNIWGVCMSLSDFIFSKNFVYRPKCYLYNYNGTNFRIVKIKSSREKGFEDMSSHCKTSKKEVDRISLSRSRRNIRELSLCNNFEYFCTITVNSKKCDRYSLDEVQDNLRKCLRNIRNSVSDFKYLIITEKHKDGAFHFHGLVSGISSVLYINDFGYLSCKKLDVLGFNSFSKIESLEKVSNYILKYITKDCVKNSKNQIYISSRGLKKAERTEINPNISDINYSYSNDFCSIQDFDVNNVSRDYILKIIDNMC